MFSNIFGQTSKEILLHLSNPEDFENISSDQLAEVLSKVSFKKFATNKINAISTLAKDSFGIKFALDSFQLQLKLLIEQINFIGCNPRKE